MQQNKKFLRVLCSLLAAALAAWCTVLLCRWVGYDLQERLGNTPSYEIINDDYSQIIDIPAKGLTQAMPLKAGQPFYGVRFKFSTHGQLYKSGMTMVEAYNEAGEQILFAAGNFLNIWDDIFTEFTCNEAYIPDHDETLTIRLYNESAWDGPLGVWASEGEVSGMPLSVETPAPPKNTTPPGRALSMSVRKRSIASRGTSIFSFWRSFAFFARASVMCTSSCRR